MIALIIPTYNESKSLPILLERLVKDWHKQDMIVVVDDSEKDEYLKTERIINDFSNVGFSIHIIKGQLKNGRGAAVLSAMKFLLETNKEIEFIIEADADGSHQSDDILSIKNYDASADFVIGSRYREESLIIGWSFSRRLLSRVLNTLIPRILRIGTTDITNGLRRYSLKATKILCSYKIQNKGFIYLSEQALYLKHAKIHPKEIPIIFAPRIAGKSSVTKRDLINSLIGLIRVWKLRKISND
jgi:dolichol-phosphate mannosyltransferase